MNAALRTLLLAALPAAAAGQVKLLGDMRATHDTALLDPATAADRLVVLRITPAPDSGAARESPAAVVESGSWELVHNLGATRVPPRGTFRWSKPLRAHLRKLTAEDYYSPFSSGGIILCEFHPEGSGSRQFRRVCLLPESWAQAPARAFAELRKHPDALHDVPSIAAGGEPLLASMAFRRLLRAHPAGTAEQDRLITGSEGFVRAAFVYLALRERSAVEPALRRSARSGASPAALRFTALGIFTARLLDPALARECPWTTEILTSIDRAAPPDDPYFGPLFRIMGLPRNRGR